MRSFLCLMGLVFIVVVIQEQIPMSTVYACADKEKNPPDVQAQCKRLTRGQWWSK